LFPFHVLNILWLLTYSAFVKSLAAKIEAVLNTVLKTALEPEEKGNLYEEYTELIT
jgi:hypothetical protein